MNDWMKVSPESSVPSDEAKHTSASVMFSEVCCGVDFPLSGRLGSKVWSDYGDLMSLC